MTQHNRRSFLQFLGSAAGTALAASPALANLAGTPNAVSQKHVLVIGGGLAGLTAAYELEKLGHRATVLEADSGHIGGRVRTHRFDSKNYGEFGAMRIPKVHNLTRHYASLFGLTLRPFVQSNPEAYYYARNTKLKIRDESQLNALYPNLTPAEKSMSPFDLWDKTVIKRLSQLSANELADLRRVAFQTAAVRDLDQLSLEAVLKQEGLSADAIELLVVAWAYETSMLTSMTELVREEYEEIWIHEFDEIAGGMDLLPAAFAKALKTPPQMKSEVVRIEQSQNKVAAVVRKNGSLARIEGDLMVVTVPLGVLQRIEVAPGFSGEKHKAIRQVTYDSSTKVLALAKRRFWETDEGIYGGGTYTDLPTGISYYPSDNAVAKNPGVSNSGGVMLASYTWGQPARRLAALAADDRHAVVRQNIAKIHPQMAQNGVVEQMASWSWDNHPYSAGAFCWFSPGQHETLYQHLVQPEGRVFLAGEHTSLTHTWMQGAIESGLRAVNQIVTKFPN